MLVLRCLFLFSFVFISACSKADCSAPEILEGHSDYNELVCSGMGYMQEAKYFEAIDAFHEALDIPFHETPNFELFARLALAYAKSGEFNKADQVLKKAELSLSVFTGILTCEERQQGFYLLNLSNNRVDDDLGREVAKRMCGGAYDYIYESRSLERVLIEAKLVDNYIEIRREIRDLKTTVPDN